MGSKWFRPFNQQLFFFKKNFHFQNLLVCFFGATAQIIAATIRLVTVRVKFRFEFCQRSILFFSANSSFFCVRRYLHVAHPALELASALILLADFFFTVLTTRYFPYIYKSYVFFL